MKIRRVHIENFKGIKNLDLDFCGADGKPRAVTCLLGDNGSGKTTALQAIALTLSLKTRQTSDPTRFVWPGFRPDRLGTLGETFVFVEYEVDHEEAAAAGSVLNDFRDKFDHGPNSAVRRQLQRPLPPWPESGPYPQSAFFEQGQLRYENQQRSSFDQFAQARTVALQLQKSDPQTGNLLRKLGGVFWFHQDRTINSVRVKQLPDDSPEVYQYYTQTVQLRDALSVWWLAHTSPKQNGRDRIAELEVEFSKLFPGTLFSRIEEGERPGIRHAKVLLTRDGKEFDIEEMSSGEQAVFAVWFDFLQQDIYKSVVLIDELELHLHPPQQQAMLAAIRRLAKERDCQFIITTHSQVLTDVIPQEHEIRLEGGRMCL